MSVAVVIVAGGSGFRAGGELPKQYQLIGGRAVLWWTVQAFLNHPLIAHVQLVIGQGQEALLAKALADLDLPPFVYGGASRQDSCRLGVEACANGNFSKILIHDAARPFVSAILISRIVSELSHCEAVVPGLPVADTIKKAPGGMVETTVERQHLWAIQTPQGFDYGKISAAHRRAAQENLQGLTDDASVAEACGMMVKVIMGTMENKKLTTAEDIAEADRLLQAKLFAERPDIRVGQGIDFHEFTSGDGVILCGVKIPHDKKLKGHSDADVALHALTDAILGAIGEGDIGVHFPPSDPQWKGVASSLFVAHAVKLLQQKGGIIAHADITILAEAPRISPHLSAMKAILGPLLSLSPDRIAIKATTTEKLGAIGRGEGMAALATVTIRLPLN